MPANSPFIATFTKTPTKGTFKGMALKGQTVGFASRQGAEGWVRDAKRNPTLSAITITRRPTLHSGLIAPISVSAR